MDKTGGTDKLGLRRPDGSADEEVAMTTAVLGIDIAKDTYQVTLLTRGRQARSREFQNELSAFAELTRWLRQYRIRRVHACLEATGRYGEALAEYLHDHGHPVSVVNPAVIRDYARSKLTRTKTDPVDAALIADYCRTQHPRVWNPPAPEIKELQAMVRHLEALQTSRVQENNRLKAEPPAVAVRALLEAHLAFLDEQIARLKQQIQAHIRQHPQLQHHRDLLVSIPGIGDLTAARLVAENLLAFDDTRAVAAYAGLSPAIGTSGTSVRHKTQLSKVGKAGLRKSLYFPALSAVRWNPLIQAFATRLQQRGKHPMVVLGAAMRKLLCLAYGVLKSGRPFDPHFRTGQRRCQQASAVEMASG